MKKPLALMTTTALAAFSIGMSPMVAMTGYASSLKMETKHITLDGKTMSSQVGIAAVDPSSKQLTTYMPIYYVGQALQTLGVQNH